MHVRLGRPQISGHAGKFDVPAATPQSPLSVTWMGVSTLLIDDGASAILTDGFFSRPGLARVGFGMLAPSIPRIEGCLTRAGIRRLDAVLPVHTHFDHALDSAAVAERTGALLVGGESAANIGRGHGLPEDRILVASSGEAIELGSFQVTPVASHHCPPDRFPGVIAAPVRTPARASAYKCGEAWSLLILHRPTGRTLLIQGSAGFIPGVLAGLHAEVAYLGVGNLGVLPENYLRDYWEHTVRAVGARTVIAIHWDDFSRPLSKPLRALPFAIDNLDSSMRDLQALADIDGVSLHLPSVWRPEDPWG
ncbi:MBL fold metallo-hydrolase [Mycobacterium sp. MS1601]|uniref:MBL fold metallo-hydrolase n=1 Tax=Mycobacterium sp. MS1601 TaxID=1936029 RepID=UPI00097975C8|nr:MBL fold metallo-hydrolase [Mycobacterium sp. MS1601]AQA02621.1 MBL fold metallo-hydrolase [Mycobacterium sp. MS1601]